jgi:rhodanese-related sulfurtransferase
MDRLDEILGLARERAAKANAPFAGALTPSEAHEVLGLTQGAKLIDVRTPAEWDFVGRIPGAIEIPFLSYPDNALNFLFTHSVEAVARDKDTMLLFICRAGGRSAAAAVNLTAAGYKNCYNVLEGFEGDKDADGHRNTTGGWRLAGLPWIQS